MEEGLVVVLMLCFFSLSLSSSSLDSQGLALLMLRDRVVRDPFGALSNWNAQHTHTHSAPCSWFGVQCSHGIVVTLNLKDLRLEGTLPPEIGKLAHLKSIILRNNSFSGEIPREISQLEELEVLDLGYNKFSGPFPSHIASNPSLTTLLLNNNDFFTNSAPQAYDKSISESYENKDQSSGSTTRVASIGISSFWHIGRHEDMAYRRKLLQRAKTRSRRDAKKESFSPSPSPYFSSLPPDSEPFSSSEPPSASTPSPYSPEFSPSPSPSPSASFLTPSPAPSPMVSLTTGISLPANPPQSSWISGPSPASFGNQEYTNSSKPQKSVIIWSTAGGVSLLVFVSAIAFACIRNSKVVTVKPWATGLSGQLQKAFVTGVPNLKRVEIEAACEDFSNIIGSIPDGIVYKGTLSSGVEIAVASTAVTSYRNWSKHMEAQFRKKIETLSRVNHKNFVNLIGYCEEKKPFTRMMVFEYAPNGTLFEHLHIREAERLDWKMRMRIAMGIAYCLEYMHQLEPPIAHRNLQSSSIYLTEDYTAQISDLSFWNDMAAIKKLSVATQLLETPSTKTKGNVYSFGVILFELITGRIPYDVENGFLAEYVRKGQSLRDMVDPTLNSVQEEEVEKWWEVMKECLRADPNRRPDMGEVVAMLKEITGMEPDEATPKLSPLWWAELEIMSADST